MEDVEISIFNPRVIKVWRGKGSSVEGGRVLAITLASHSYKMSILLNTSITDVLGCFRLPFFIEEDDGVEVGLSSIVPYPSIARMVWVLEIASERGGKADGFRGRCGSSNSGLILCEVDWFVTVNAVFAHVGLSEVYDAGNKEEVVDCLEVMVSGLKGFIIKTVIP